MRGVTKEKKLANKIAGPIAIVMIVIFTFMVAVSLINTRSSILTATYNDLQSNSKANGCQIQEFMNICQSTALSLRSQMEEAFAEERLLGDIFSDTIIDYSVVYPELKLNKTKYNLETFLIATAKNAVAHNSSIAGIGIMFEPYQYTENRESYALYFSSDGTKVTVADVGAYSDFSTNEYYQIAVGKTNTVFTKPYTYNETWMITGATPIVINGKFVGVINVDVSMEEFNKLSLNNENYPSMEISVISDKGVIAFDSGQKDHIGMNLRDADFINNDVADLIMPKIANASISREKYVNKEKVEVCSFFYPLKAGGETWQTITTVSVKDIEYSSTKSTLFLILFCIAALFIILFFIVVLLRRGLRPIKKIVYAAEQIAQGHLGHVIDVESNDEIGGLARTFQCTCTSLQSMISDISQILNKIACNDLDIKTNTEYLGDYNRIKVSINNITRNLNMVIGKINQSSEQVSKGAEQISDSAQVLSQGSIEQASSIDVLSMSINEISDTIKQTAESAQSARTESINAKDEIECCDRQMHEMIEAMKKIKECSGEIENIIKTVEDIAFQSNILSLNASVEAARVGEAGKGFAVVANEVRSLAGKSSEAVKNITNLIEDTLKAVENGVSIANNTAKTMLTIVEDNTRVSNFMDEIANASKEQAEAIVQITQGMSEVAGVIQTNSATAEESAAASQILSDQAQVLKDLVEEFHIKKEILIQQDKRNERGSFVALSSKVNTKW